MYQILNKAMSDATLLSVSMSQKIIHVDGVGDVPFYKRSGTNNIKIRISGSEIKVSMPLWVPYKAAVLYVSQRANWIAENLQKATLLHDGSKIGKDTILRLESSGSERYSSRQRGNELIIKIPATETPESKAVQEKITKYAIKALQREAEELLLPRIRNMATQQNFEVNTIEIKNLKSRWGSCSNKKDLAFSLFLIQLPWHCIDYVIYHELAHTIHMNHSRNFWDLVETLVPDYKLIRKEMKQYSPHVVLQA